MKYILHEPENLIKQKKYLNSYRKRYKLISL